MKPFHATNLNTHRYPATMTRWTSFRPILPTAPLPHSQLGEVVTYVPGPEEYRLTTGLTMANPSTRGVLFQSDYDAWWDHYRRRFSVSGLAELAGISVGMHAVTRLGMPIIHSALFAAGITAKGPLFVLSTSLLAVLTSGVMAFYGKFRYDSPEDQGLLRQWGTGLVYLLPSMFLGMGLMCRWGFGNRLLQDLALEPIQAGVLAVVGKGLEAEGFQPKSQMTLWERGKMEFLEGIPFLLTGRATGGRIDRWLGTLGRPHTPPPLLSFPPIHGLRQPDMTPLAAMAAPIKVRTMTRRVPAIARLLHTDKAPTHRGTAITALFEIGEEHPRQRKRIGAILKDWQEREHDPSVQGHLQNILDFVAAFWRPTAARPARGPESSTRLWHRPEATLGQWLKGNLLEVPADWDAERIRGFGLQERLREMARSRGEDLETYLSRFGLSKVLLNDHIWKKRIPHPERLKKISEAAGGIPDPVLLLSFLPTERVASIEIRPILSPSIVVDEKFVGKRPYRSRSSLKSPTQK